MPNTREKLIELLDKVEDCNAKYCIGCEFSQDIEGCVRRQKEIIADCLIANGVTFATDNNVGHKWIPVTERLPDDSIPSTHYLCYWNGRIRVCKYWRTRKVFELIGKTVKVTHWMPLPEPPKEVE